MNAYSPDSEAQRWECDDMGTHGAKISWKNGICNNNTTSPWIMITQFLYKKKNKQTMNPLSFCRELRQAWESGKVAFDVCVHNILVL